MKLAVSVISPEVRGEAPLALLSGSFAQRCAKAAAMGYRGVELVVCEPEALSVNELSDTLAANGLAPAAIATGFLAGGYGLTLTGPDPMLRAQALERLEELIRLAAALGSKIVTIGSFRGKAAPLGGVGPAGEQLHLALAEAEPLCRELRVRLALEPIFRQESDFLTDAAQVMDFLEAGDHSDCGLLLDSYHVFQGEREPLDCFRRFRHRLLHVHLADLQRKPVGQGGIDFAAMEGVLKEIGYRGWQSAELARGSAPDENAAASARFLSWTGDPLQCEK